MLENWTPILLFFTLVTGFALVSVVGSRIIGMRKPTPEKAAPYECGMNPVGTARERFSVKFYLVAMLFILFDIEVVFLYPWAQLFKEFKLAGLGSLIFGEMVIFLGVLGLGLVYVWKRGALEWE